MSCITVLWMCVRWTRYISNGYHGSIPRRHPQWGRNAPLSILLTKMMLMRRLLITISPGLMTEKCLNARNVFLTKSVTLTYQTIWLITILWTWKISKNNRRQMMLCCNMQLNVRTDICISAWAQLMISYATLSQDILQRIGKLHYQPAFQPTINWFHQVTSRQKEAIHANL